MGTLSVKRLLLIGFIVVLLLAIPATLYILKQQSNTQSHAVKSTNLSFTPTSSPTSPINANVGDSIPLTVYVDPVQNSVTFLQLEIDYDPSVLQVDQSSFKVNNSTFPTIISGPTFSSGKITAQISTGANPTSALTKAAAAATINFTALAPTSSGQPTEIKYNTALGSNNASNTVVLSAGSSDTASENVLSTATSAYIAIGGGTPTDTPTPTVAVAVATPTPASSSGVLEAPTDTPTETPTDTLTPIIPTNTIAPTGSTEVTFGVGAVLTVVTVVGGILFFVL
ncbi:MAG TPA: hypothetical protein VMR41_05270 [Patescibacteria group bacterium]|nr:hypothetical protein [Patescibacteria group bacterium]